MRRFIWSSQDGRCPAPFSSAVVQSDINIDEAKAALVAKYGESIAPLLEGPPRTLMVDFTGEDIVTATEKTFTLSELVEFFRKYDQENGMYPENEWEGYFMLTELCRANGIDFSLIIPEGERPTCDGSRHNWPNGKPNSPAVPAPESLK